MSALTNAVSTVTSCNETDLIPIAPQMRGAEVVRYGHVNNDDDAQATVTRLTDINSNPNTSTSAPRRSSNCPRLGDKCTEQLSASLVFHIRSSWRTCPLVTPLTLADRVSLPAPPG
jgi:hypothetical protein